MPDHDTQAQERWHVLQTLAKHEKMVARFMEQNGVLTFIPAFTGYVFAQCPDNRMSELAGRRPQGMAHVLPYTMTDEDIERMRQDRERIREVMLSKAQRTLVGERVIMTNGQFQGFGGEVIIQSQRTARVQFSIFQRPVLVTVNISDIRLASS